ncbi:1-deoxy-D-xylulose 5-phosphate reductoisomerase [compost metagenome]
MVLNAANEVAVDAFLSRRLSFDRIHAVNLETLEKMPLLRAPGSLEDLLSLDAQARVFARVAVARWALA